MGDMTEKVYLKKDATKNIVKGWGKIEKKKLFRIVKIFTRKKFFFTIMANNRIFSICRRKTVNWPAWVGHDARKHEICTFILINDNNPGFCVMVSDNICVEQLINVVLVKIWFSTRIFRVLCFPFISVKFKWEMGFPPDDSH